MPLNASGAISLGGPIVGQSVNLELGKSATALISMNDTDLRTLFGVASGQISMSQGYGRVHIQEMLLVDILQGVLRLMFRLVKLMVFSIQMRQL